ncbi:hypothetical protein F4677DRAFT_445550 [Hypoxylon crocopeplum]|nr:hypothetical protein F4677DRAFT_445550 [Hypoxylon crocopeplum]
MKFATAILAFAGAANAAKSFIDFSNGMYTIPIVNGTLDLDSATRDAEHGSNINTTLAALSSPQLIDMAAGGMPGLCVPQFPTRKTYCRTRHVPRADYLRALARFLDWIETGPDEGWVPKHSCKALVWGEAVVSACTTRGPNPTCRDELVEAMRELDVFCALDLGGDIKVSRWAKRYARHHVRDSLDTDVVVGALAADDEEGEGQGQEEWQGQN